MIGSLNEESKMKTISDTRRDNLKFAVALYYPSARQLAIQVGVAENTISRIKNGTNSMSDRVARMIEAHAELPTGWLDISHKDIESARLSGDRSAGDAIQNSLDQLTENGVNAVIVALTEKMGKDDALKLAAILLARASSDV